MKVVYIYRKLGFSIEELFRTVSNALRDRIEVVAFEAGGPSQLFSDVIALRRLKADVYHVTGDVHYFVPLLPSGRTVLTVHDINHFLFDLRGWKKLVYKWIWLTLPLRSAAAVTCVSQDTRDKLVEHLEVPADRVTVIENCCSPLFKHAPASFNTKRPRILQVGTSTYKNVPRLVRALSGLDCTLVILGPLNAEIEEALRETRVPYENKTGLSHAEVADEYVAADVVTFPSLYEGFGVPVIEAQMTGRPLVTSNVSPLREVAGPGACLVDPLNEASIRDGITRLIEDAGYRESVVAAGLKNAHRFMPGAVSEQYLRVYRQVSTRERSVGGQVAIRDE